MFSRYSINQRSPTFFTRFLVVRTVSKTFSVSGARGNADELESTSCGRRQSRSFTHRLNHSHLPGLLRRIVSRKTLQLCNVSRSTATHGDPFDTCWLAVWLKRALFTTWCASPRDIISHQFQHRFVAFFHFLALTLLRQRQYLSLRPGVKTYTQRCLNSQLSGNLESSAFTSTANVQTFLICRCKA